MDVRAYFRALRELAAAFEDEQVLVISLPTSDGGKGGRALPLSREIAARMVMEGRARHCSAEEWRAYREEQSGAQAERNARELSGDGEYVVAANAAPRKAKGTEAEWHS